MFGSFIEEEEAPTYGLIHNIETFNPLKIAFHEWVDLTKDVFRPGIRITDRVRYIFGRPGWSHDGSKLTVPQMRQLARDEATPQLEHEEEEASA